jgi:hypothetical protein
VATKAQELYSCAQYRTLTFVALGAEIRGFVESHAADLVQFDLELWSYSVWQRINKAGMTLVPGWPAPKK